MFVCTLLYVFVCYFCFFCVSPFFFFFFFNDTATTEIYTLSLHDALPILTPPGFAGADSFSTLAFSFAMSARCRSYLRSEEHTSELQSRPHLVCRLLLEKKKKNLVWTSRIVKTSKACRTYTDVASPMPTPI